MPVIIETNMNNYFHRSLYDQLHLEENLFTHIEWLGIENEQDMVTFLGHIYNQSQAEMISRNLGRNLHFLRTLTDSLLSSPNPDFLSTIQLQSPDFASYKAAFHRKINALYLTGEAEHLLNQGVLDFHVRHALQSFVKMGGEAYVVHAIGEELRGHAIYKALMEVGILYPEKHEPYISFASKGYSVLAKMYLESRPLSQLKRLEYMIFTLKDAFLIRDLAMNKNRTEIFPYKNPEILWDTDLHSRYVGRRPDPVRTGTPLDDLGSPHAEIVYGKSFFMNNQFVRTGLYPIFGYISIIFQYPFKWLHKREEIRRKGLEKTPPALLFHKYFDEEKHTKSDLPNYGMEAQGGLTREAERRTRLRGLFLQENPAYFGQKVKWRQVRRFVKDAKKTVKQHYIWQ